MENAWITGILVLVLGYYLYVSLRNRKKITMTDIVSNEILSNEEYKVKGQWDR